VEGEGPLGDDSAHLASRVEQGDGFLTVLGKTHPVVA
jgi:hypothetical protein